MVGPPNQLSCVTITSNYQFLRKRQTTNPESSERHMTVSEINCQGENFPWIINSNAPADELTGRTDKYIVEIIAK